MPGVNVAIHKEETRTDRIIGQIPATIVLVGQLHLQFRLQVNAIDVRSVVNPVGSRDEVTKRLNFGARVGRLPSRAIYESVQVSSGLKFKRRRLYVPVAKF